MQLITNAAIRMEKMGKHVVLCFERNKQTFEVATLEVLFNKFLFVIKITYFL